MIIVNIIIFSALRWFLQCAVFLNILGHAVSSFRMSSNGVAPLFSKSSLYYTGTKLGNSFKNTNQVDTYTLYCGPQESITYSFAHADCIGILPLCAI